MGVVRVLDMKRLPVGLGVNRDGFDIQLAAGAGDAHGDLAAVGDQDALKHECSTESRVLSAE
mgnify:CR=1 FL=1